MGGCLRSLPTSSRATSQGCACGMPACVLRRVRHQHGTGMRFAPTLPMPCHSLPPSGNVDRNMAERADQAMRSIEQLGPAYVKVGVNTVGGLAASDVAGPGREGCRAVCGSACCPEQLKGGRARRRQA